MTVYIGRNRTYTLGQAIDSGGEGTIFDVDRDTVAKIYKNSVDKVEREEKLLAMLKMGLPGGLEDFVTWPLDILRDDAGHFVGFTMRKLRSKYLLEMLTEYPRSDNHPHSRGYATFWILALNLANLFEDLHRNHIVIGDVNDSNIGFMENGLPVIYDCDSFHVSDSHPCTVSRPEYIPYFLYDAITVGFDKFKGKTFRESSDDWALATHIFELVCNGCHPFACEKEVKGSVEVPNIPENIRYRRTPFFVPMQGLRPPSYAPSLALIPEEIREMFRRAFVGDECEIPSAAEWRVAIKNVLDKGFTCVCGVNHHQIPLMSAQSDRRNCPLCRARQRLDGAVSKDDEYRKYLSAKTGNLSTAHNKPSGKGFMNKIRNGLNLKS